MGMPFMPWQRMVADVAGEYDAETGVPAYREVIVTVPRQSGKTTLQLVQVLDRSLMWGRPCRTAYTAQTGLDARQKMVNDWMPALGRSPFRATIARELRGAAETAIEFSTGSRAEVLATSEESGHGRTLDLGLIDEAFADEDDRREQAIVPAMTTIGDAQMFIFSTMGTGRSSFLNRKVATGRALVEAGVTHGIAYFEWSAPDDADADDPQVWRACMPALGHTTTEASVRHARMSMTDGEFRRAFLNQQREHDDRWLPAGAWLARRHPGGLVQPPEGTPITLGFDGSYNNDATALVGCTLEGHLFKVAVWERPSGASDDWVVPRDKVDVAIADAFRRWKVRGMAVDKSRWVSEVQQWAERYGSQVVIDMPQSRARMVPASAHFYTAVVQGLLTHDGDVDLARHLSNAITRETPDGAYVTKEGRHSPLKVDLAIAAVLAHEALNLLPPAVPGYFSAIEDDPRRPDIDDEDDEDDDE
jgi:phage terminase large subunit-like protein